MERAFLKIRGVVRGPFDVRQIQTFLRQGKIGKYNEISEDGVEWRAIRDVLGDGNSGGGRGAVRSGGRDELSVVADGDADESGENGADDGDAVWFVSNDGVSGIGPYTTADVWRLLKRGRATPDSFVWLEGLPARPLKDVPEFGKAAISADGAASASTRSAVALQGESRCERCGAPIPVDADFCPKCGGAKRLGASSDPAPKRSCPRCRADVAIAAQICPKCGRKLVRQIRKSRWIYVVLGLLGGIVGTHNFYGRRLERGWNQLATAIFGAALFATPSLAARFFDNSPLDGVVGERLVLGGSACFGVLGVWILFDLFVIKEDGDGLAFEPLFDDAAVPNADRDGGDAAD